MGDDEAMQALEPFDRLSRSKLWQLQRRFFEQQGMAAWSTGTVPHWVTSNAYVARRYVEVVVAFLRDRRAAIDAAQPVYVVELGAGAGRLGFQFLRALRLPDDLRDLDVRYVMTDFADANVAAWRAHPQLAAWRDSKRLQLARFDAECDGALALDDGEVIARSANPLCVLANYVFDGLPIDAFEVRDDGALVELAAALHGHGGALVDPAAVRDDPALLLQTTLRYRAAALDGYGDAALDAVRDEHRALPPGTRFALPIASLRCLARLAAMAPSALVLSTDKGESTLDAVRDQPSLDLTLHGSFSISVNCFALARFVERAGGAALLPTTPPRTVATCAFVLGDAAQLDATRAAYAALDAASPDAFLARKQQIVARADELALRDLLGFLYEAGYDAKLIDECAVALRAGIATASEGERLSLRHAIREARAGHLEIGEAFDASFLLATLAAALEAWPEAIALFEASLRTHGDDAHTHANLALCRREAEGIA